MFAHHDDARRWYRVYAELIAVTEGLAERAELGARAGLAVPGLDAEAAQLHAQLDHYRSRRAYWRERHEALIGLTLNDERRCIDFGDRSMQVTRREFALLKLLLDRAGSPCSAGEVLSEAWGDVALHEEQVRTYVVRVRRRLRALGVPASVVNHPRRGYALRFD
ncbi:MAG: winged helix-turn-helix domain-containing protein [Candidatus Dormibacteria bacterium]